MRNGEKQQRDCGSPLASREMQVTLLNSVNEAASSPILAHETVLRKTQNKPYVNHVYKYFREPRVHMQAALAGSA